MVASCRSEGGERVAARVANAIDSVPANRFTIGTGNGDEQIMIRKFNGNEIEFLMGNDEDRPYDGIVERIHAGYSDGYEEESVVVKHPDGKLYRFKYFYNSEHGIAPTREWPKRECDAVEVMRIETKTYKYVPVEE